MVSKRKQTTRGGKGLDALHERSDQELYAIAFCADSRLGLRYEAVRLLRRRAEARRADGTGAGGTKAGQNEENEPFAGPNRQPLRRDASCRSI